MNMQPETVSTFEETYPKMPFAALVRLAVWAGSMLRNRDDATLHTGSAVPAGA